MPVGKFRGRKVGELSTPYIRWALESLTVLDDVVATALLEELQRRRGVLGFENAVADPGAPSVRREIEVGPEALLAAWEHYAGVFLEATGHRMQPCTLGFRTNQRVLGTWYPWYRRLVVSNYWILPRRTFRSVLVHEMCHEYITETGREEHYPHGDRWRAVARVMEAATGLDISRTTTPTGFVANERRRQFPDVIRIYDDVNG